MKRFLGKFGLLLMVLMAVSAFTIAPITLFNTAKIGPYFTTTLAFDSSAINAIGGQVEIFLAADSVQVGNVVYLSAANSVKRDTILVNYNKVVGVVVGGTRTNMQGTNDSVAVGSTLAATVGQRVLVLRRGRFWVQLDTGTGFAPGTQIIPSTKAGSRGRAMARTTAIDSLNRIFGKMLDSGVSGAKRIADINVRP